jgi:hypothetical protein
LTISKAEMMASKASTAMSSLLTSKAGQNISAAMPVWQVTPIQAVKKVWEKIAPLQLAERTWDNVGIMIGMFRVSAVSAS